MLKLRLRCRHLSVDCGSLVVSDRTPESSQDVSYDSQVLRLVVTYIYIVYICLYVTSPHDIYIYILYRVSESCVNWRLTLSCLLQRLLVKATFSH